MRAVLVFAVLALAGCSGGGADPELRLTEEQWASEADRICAEYDERLDALEQPGSLEELERMAGEAEPIAEKGLDALRRLDPPEELEERVDEWLARNAENVRAIGELREAAAAGDTARVQELASDAVDNEAEADRLASELGLDDCASGR